MNLENNSSVLIIAGEASSAHYAAQLLRLWKSKGLTINAFGVGSREMESLGFECLGRSEEMAVVGIQEVLREWKTIWRVFHACVDQSKKRQPKFALLMDYPDFNLRLAKRLSQAGIKVFYYISPQIWAWRQGRVKIIKKYVTKMLVLFPFEVEFYSKHGVDVEFVGHPLLDEIRPELFDEKFENQEREKFGLDPRRKVLGLMPGSRRGEIHHHLDLQIEVARKLVSEFKDLQVALFIAPTLTKEYVQERLKGVDFPLVLVKRDPFEMIAMADVVLCASGTATLMVGLLEKPMVIMYIVNPISKFIGELLVRNLKMFGLSNIVLGAKVSSEFKNDECSVDSLAGELRKILADQNAFDHHRSELSKIKDRLGKSGANKRVASILEQYL